MKITINKPLAFSEIGRKDNQEDCIYPKPEALSDTDCLFILCDGMGGHENGEVASRTVCEVMGRYFTKDVCKDETEVKECFFGALEHAYDSLDNADEGGERKMGTTMACVCFHTGGALVAHIGDSRIYQLRPSLYDEESGCLGIIYQSEDHSLVNDLLKLGEITPEEAKVFPRKNVITRAMQPAQDRRAKSDVFIFDDIQKGDYFFMCSDGILEQLTNIDLARILSDKEVSDTEKMVRIKAICDGRTKDNYTCILIPVKEVVHDVYKRVVVETDTIEAVVENPAVEDADMIDGYTDAPINISKDAEMTASSDRYSNVLWIVLMGVIVLSVLYMLCVRSNKGDSEQIPALPAIENIAEEVVHGTGVDSIDTEKSGYVVIKKL